MLFLYKVNMITMINMINYLNNLFLIQFSYFLVSTNMWKTMPMDFRIKTWQFKAHQHNFLDTSWPESVIMLGRAASRGLHDAQKTILMYHRRNYPSAKMVRYFSRKLPRVISCCHRHLATSVPCEFRSTPSLANQQNIHEPSSLHWYRVIARTCLDKFRSL